MSARGPRSPRLPKLPPRASDAHKGTFGTVLVVAGSETMLGAAILCARGALRSGAGLVRVALPRELCPLLPLAVPPATTVDRSDAKAFARAIDEASCVVVGPGLGVVAATKRLVAIVLRRATVPVVLDADALNALAPLRRMPRTKALLRRKPRTKAPILLLPHPGEAARLLATSTREVQADREAAVRQLAVQSGGIAVLKGHRTLVDDGARTFVNRTGNPGLATGGTGDVLAGVVAALLAQGMTPFDAACLGVHVHGKAGDLVKARLSEAGLCADDLPLAVAEVLR